MVHQGVVSSLVQVMYCCLSSRKPLPEPMRTFCYELSPNEQTLVKSVSKHQIFLSQKCIWKCCHQNVGHFDHENKFHCKDIVSFYHKISLWAILFSSQKSLIGYIPKGNLYIAEDLCVYWHTPVWHQFCTQSIYVLWDKLCTHAIGAHIYTMYLIHTWYTQPPDIDIPNAILHNIKNNDMSGETASN